MSNSGGEKMAPALKSAEQIAGEVADLLKVDNREHIWLKFIILAKERHFTSDQRDALKKKLARTQDHYVGKDDWTAYVVLRDIKDFSPDQREVLRGVACSTRDPRLASEIIHRIKDLTDEQRTLLESIVRKMDSSKKSSDQVRKEVADLLKVDDPGHKAQYGIWQAFYYLDREKNFTPEQREALKAKLARSPDHWTAYVVLRDIKDFSPDQREVLRGVACSTQESRLAYDIFHRIKDLTDEQRTRLAPLVKRREILKREYDLLVNKRRPMG